MNRFVGLLLGVFAGGISALVIGFVLMHDDLRMTDGLAPGFAWLGLFILCGVGILLGGVAGWLLGREQRLGKYFDYLAEQLKPPHEREDE